MDGLLCSQESQINFLTLGCCEDSSSTLLCCAVLHIFLLALTFILAPSFHQRSPLLTWTSLAKYLFICCFYFNLICGLRTAAYRFKRWMKKKLSKKKIISDFFFFFYFFFKKKILFHIVMLTSPSETKPGAHLTLNAAKQ